ncbi:MAG: alcohol dehydrogenase catalytic domain-containing protein [Thermodesulfovibrionales bacterium]|nr:alcohol dehydrogenase catalytic domain-containing protein [Thermodesulfovibrionales bacterium]
MKLQRKINYNENQSYYKIDLISIMLACFLIKPGVIELREIPKPEPAEGEILLKIEAALTCGTDLKAFSRGHFLIPMPGPFGHEFSGTVAEVGKGVKKFKAGDAVMAVHTAPCHNCKYCAVKAFNLCENLFNTKVLGAYAEYILLPKHVVKQNVFFKPYGLPFDKAAMLEPLACVVHGINKLPLKNNKALIIGAGPIGLLHLLLLKLRGAKVLITGLEHDRLDLAYQMGADMITPPSDLLKAIEGFSDGIGVDFVFECTGQVEVWERSINYLRRGGTVILFGGCKKDTIVTYDTYKLHYDEMTLKGAFHFNPSDVRIAYELLRDGLDVSPLISGRLSLKDVTVAFEKLSRGEGLKYAIIP